MRQFPSVRSGPGLCRAAPFAPTDGPAAAQAQATPAVAPNRQTARARIKIDVDRTIGTVDPLLFGNFSEHLGRMIYGGIYDEKSPLSDATATARTCWRPSRASASRSCAGRAATSRPATTGRTASARRTSVRCARSSPGTTSRRNRFGTDEFLRYAELIGTEPYICINLGLGTIDDARHWVEYTNGTQKTFWADQRRKNGRDTPYNVKYWALGNEIDGPWQLGHKNAEDYSKVALEAAKAMRARRSVDQAGGERIEQLRRRLDRLEPHRAPDAAQHRRLHRDPHLHQQPRATTSSAISGSGSRPSIATSRRPQG